MKGYRNDIPVMSRWVYGADCIPDPGFPAELAVEMLILCTEIVTATW